LGNFIFEIVFVTEERFFLAIGRNDVIGVKRLLEADECKRLLNQPERRTGHSPLMTAAVAGAL